jgi:hypothetical protein
MRIRNPAKLAGKSSRALATLTGEEEQKEKKMLEICLLIL